MEAMFDLKRPAKDLKKNWGRSLYEATEVKMEARSEMLLKFWTKYCFALFRDAVWRKIEIPYYS